MKRLELALTFLQVPFDYCLLILAGLTAYTLRFTSYVTSIRPILFDLPFQKFLSTLILVTLGWMLIFIITGLYKINPSRRLVNDIGKILMASASGFSAIAIYLFFTLQK